MNNKKYIWIFFAIMVLAQLYVPAKMIVESELIINHGKTYKFDTQPVDPYDPFRGKYISLRYEVERHNYVIDDLPNYKANDGKRAYAELKTSSDGFAKISKLTINKENVNGDYLEVKTHGKSNGEIRVSLPFDRYYMEESIAKPTEDYVRRLRRDDTSSVYGIVSVKEGKGVLTEVMMNDRPLAEIVREDLNK